MKYSRGVPSSSAVRPHHRVILLHRPCLLLRLYRLTKERNRIKNTFELIKIVHKISKQLTLTLSPSSSLLPDHPQLCLRRLPLIRSAAASSPSFAQPPLSLIGLLTKEMVRIKQNKIKKEYKTRLTIIIPPSIAAFTPLSLPRPRLLLRHRLFRSNCLRSSVAAAAFPSASSYP